MSETQTLWLVLGLVYAIECVCWLRRDAIGFRSWLGRRWRAVRPAQIAGNHRGGFVPVHPLPPLGIILVAHPLPLELAPDGFVAENGAVVRWNDATPMEVANKALKAGGAVICRCGSNAHAAELGRKLHALAACDAASRGAAILELLRRSLDAGEIRARIDELKRDVSTLRLLCIGLWTFVFAIAPTVVYWRGLGQTWWLLLAGLFALMIPVALVFRGEHRRRHNDAEDERFSFFLTFLLSPASAIRAVDALSRAAVAGFHPLGVARVLCDEETFGAHAAIALREARFPAPREAGAVGASIRDFAEAAWRETLEEWLRAQCFDVERVFQAPARMDDGSAGYCPRCLTQFTTLKGICGDCGGVELKPLR